MSVILCSTGTFVTRPVETDQCVAGQSAVMLLCVFFCHVFEAWKIQPQEQSIVGYAKFTLPPGALDLSFLIPCPRLKGPRDDGFFYRGKYRGISSEFLQDVWSIQIPHFFGAGNLSFRG